MKTNLFILALCFFWILLQAQPEANWDDTKLMTQRLGPTETLNGTTFLFDDWIEGNIEFANGEKVEGVLLKYDIYHDELLANNITFSTVVKIEKASIQSFHLFKLGENWDFEQLYFDGTTQSNHFFRVFYKGEIELLCQYKVTKENTSMYMDKTGKMKCQEYYERRHYFLYSPSSGFTTLRLNRKSFLRRVSRENRPKVRKLLSQGNLKSGNPLSFARTLELIETNNIKLQL